MGGVAFFVQPETSGIYLSMKPKGEWEEFEGSASEGVWVFRKGSTVAVLRDGASSVEQVRVSSLRPAIESCDVSLLGPEGRSKVVQAALAIGNMGGWALATVLKQSDATASFISKGGLAEWLPLALGGGFQNLVGLTAGEKSGLGNVLRFENLQGWKAMINTPLIASDDTAAVVETEDTTDGAFVVARALCALGIPKDLPVKDTEEPVPVRDVNELLADARAVLTNAPGRRVMLVRALAGREQPQMQPSEADRRCGLVPSTADVNHDERKDKVRRLADTTSDTLLQEAVRWWDIVLALDVCAASMLHCSRLAEGCVLSELSSSVPPEQLSSLCLAFEKNLELASDRIAARATMMALASRNFQLVQSILELALAHLVGSLGLKYRACEDGLGAEVHESQHPYNSSEHATFSVSMPGATNLRITFDPQCKSESNCDFLTFKSGSQEWRRTGSGPWEDFEIAADNFEYTWHSDYSAEYWGYRFTVTPEGISKRKVGQASLSDGLWLQEFLLDLVAMPLANKDDQLTATVVLRPEFAALLLAHVARHFDQRLVDILHRFIQLCTENGVDLDWACARSALEALMRTAQEQRNQSIVQHCAGLRLELQKAQPSAVSTKVALEAPRFVTHSEDEAIASTTVALLNQDQSCVSRTRRDVVCHLHPVGLSNVTFRRLAEVEAWVGAVWTGCRSGSSSEEGGPCVFLRLTDGATLVGNPCNAIDVSDPVPTDALKQVRVLIENSKSEMVFEGEGFSRTIKLPAASQSEHASSGRWRLAAKLCGFGSSVGIVSLPGISDSVVQKLAVSTDNVKAILARQQPRDEFLAEAFVEWWSTCGVDTGGDQSWDVLEEGQILVTGAGVPKYDGIYNLTTSSGHASKPEYANAAGCKLFYEDFGEDLRSWCLNEIAEVPAMYASCLGLCGEDVNSLDELCGPWFAASEDAGKAPLVYGSIGPPSLETLAEFSPPRCCSKLASDSSELVEEAIVVSRVVRVGSFTIALATRHTELCEPRFLYSEGEGSPKDVSGCTRRFWGKSGCVITPTQEWTSGKDPVLHISGGDGYSTLRLCRHRPLSSSADQWAKLRPKMAMTSETLHPLRPERVEKLKVSVPSALGLTLQFDQRCELPPGEVALVTLDEAGLQPASLKRGGSSTSAISKSIGSQVQRDASQGILSHLRDESFKLDSPTCYIHCPVPRPVQWEPLRQVLPVFEESPHPYEPSMCIKKHIQLPGAVRLRVEFSTQCNTEPEYDTLIFFRDSTEEVKLYSYSGTESWENFTVDGDQLFYTFTSDGSNQHWGYAFTVSSVQDEASGLSDDIVTSFPQGSALGGTGTVLFTGECAAQIETPKTVSISNFLDFEGWLYATLDNAPTDNTTDSGTQSDWLALPEEWELVPNRNDVNTEVVGERTWSTHAIVLKDGTAFGTKRYQPGRKCRVHALEVATAADGCRAYRPKFALARVLVRKRAENSQPAGSRYFKFSGTLPLPKQPFDKKGVLYWLGTNRGKTNWSNPFTSGVVGVVASTEDNRSYPMGSVVSHTPATWYSKNAQNQWIYIDLGANLRLKANYYCYRTVDTAATTQTVRNWELQGSIDASDWKTLIRHVSEAVLAQRSSSHSAGWEIPRVASPGGKGFRYFRIFQFGPNVDNKHYLACGGLELYGVLRAEDGEDLEAGDEAPSEHGDEDGAQAEDGETRPCFVVRHSPSALSWLRTPTSAPGVAALARATSYALPSVGGALPLPLLSRATSCVTGASTGSADNAATRVLAGEVALDFTGAPVSAGDIALGLAIAPPHCLRWALPLTSPAESEAAPTSAPPPGPPGPSGTPPVQGEASPAASEAATPRSAVAPAPSVEGGSIVAAVRGPVGGRISEDRLEALGVESGAIADGQITSSSYYSSWCSAGRLRNRSGHWSPSTDDMHTSKAWMQIDLLSMQWLGAVATQGSALGREWVKNFEVHLSSDAQNWVPAPSMKSGTLFKGNRDQNSSVINCFAKPMHARYIRFVPKEWCGHACMRVEVYKVGPPPLAWWWRCDGELLDRGDPVQSRAACFGAGDVIGVVAALKGRKLYRVEFILNGTKVRAFKFGDGVDLPQDNADGTSRFALCLGLRRTPACASLLPGPSLLVDQDARCAMPAAQLDAFEEAAAEAIFKAMDSSKDDLLDRTEIADVLGGARGDLFDALDSSKDDKVSPREWQVYCLRVKAARGPIGLGLFLDSFRKKLVHIGRGVALPKGDSATARDAWGVRVTATPRGFAPDGLLRVARDVAPTEWAAFERLALHGWTLESDRTLAELADWLAGKLAKARENCTSLTLACRDMWKFKADRRQAFPTLMEPAERLAARFVIIKHLNIWIRDRMLPLCDLGTLRDTAFGRCVSDIRDMLFNHLKMKRFNEIVDATKTTDEGSLRLNRAPATECSTAGDCDFEGTKMLLAQASTLALSISDGVFRSTGPNYNRPICIYFEGEEGVDQGGLYRDFLVACTTELMSKQLPLFIPTPNSKNNAGECREAWTLSPRPLTRATRRMLKFLGRLMGVCVRRGDVMPLALSRITWKLLVGDKPGIGDLAASDVAAAESVRHFMEVGSFGVGPEDFEACFGDIRFVYHDSLGNEVPLCEGGSQKRVSFDNAEEFGRKVLEFRTTEASAQVECILAGLATVIPVGCLSLWSFRDLEFRVCGDPRVDIALMKARVIYESCSPEETRVQWLWAALESFSQQDRQCFIRFCWGRSRLPPEGSPIWGDGFRVCGASDLPDDGLPRAHTCFFQIDLPRYSTRQIAIDRIRYAIQNCVSHQNI
eukprot:TRINITY_DN11153_c2_g1_i1.p1 TRINITY_DN11153_c2_g1~~TRINITY_DN11153_c2_g1_i1.p1  ORF type:complete len:2849 (+),score=400.83 TRINITY_DN11153_c2_g1_i1:249-8549(+)